MKFILLMFFVAAEPALAQTTSLINYPEVTIGAHGTGKALSLFVQREQAQKLLPQGLELAAADEFPSGMHLISIMFIGQKDFSLYSGQMPVPLNPYNELVIAVNHVRKKGGRAIFWYFNTVYVDSLPALIGGRYFGYNKFLGSFAFGNSSLTVSNLKNERLLKMSFAPPENYDHDQFQNQFALLRREVSYPVIGKLFGNFVCTQFIWEFEEAITYPIDSRWQIGAALSPYLSPEYNAVSTGALAVSSSLESSWKLSGPRSCPE